jgi:N-acetylmuramoyl-L-alanine amidase
VEALGSNPAGSWYRIRRPSDNLTGWSSSEYLEQVTTTPPPPAEGGRYRVNTRSLYVRDGPGTNYKSIGSLVSNDLVELLQINADKTWMRVRRLTDGLTGWASSAYLVKVTTLPPTDGQKYKVTATTRIHVREGPGTQYKSRGYLQPNEIVTAISANPEQTWRQIRRNDGLTGWSSARYLALLVTL